MEQVKFGALIPKELNDSLNSNIPWGLKTRLFIQVLRRLDYELRTGGNKALAEWLNWKP